MKHLVNIALFCSLLLIVGCANKPCPEPITKIEYVTVNVPVKYKIKRPNRPKMTKADSIPIYLKEVTTYTETLEMIIDNANK